MRLIPIFFIIAILFLTISSCNKENNPPSEPPSNSINKIMPLGASRVEGARPEFESFRYELWKDLITNDWEFDFIGSQSDNASYPAFNGNDFDMDHEGRGGWTSGQILNSLDDWLAATGHPDIVLFSSPGGNDALESLPYSQAVSNINAIIDKLQSANPSVTIIIEQIAPGHSDIMTAELTDYLEQLQQDAATIANDQSTSSSQVIAVDMFTGFSDSYLADDVHYNETGADFIAGRYYDVLVGVLMN